MGKGVVKVINREMKTVINMINTISENCWVLDKFKNCWWAIKIIQCSKKKKKKSVKKIFDKSETNEKN